MQPLASRRTVRTSALLAAVAVSAGLAAPAARACFMISPQPVQVWLDHIHVDITDQVAVKTYNCTFKNLNAQAIVGGTCYMELEPGAQVDDMSVLVDGKEMKAEILDVEKAKQVFTDAVQKGGSPALLEYFGNQLIQTQVPRVPPNGTVTIKLKYTTVLQRKDGLVRLQMLNTNPKALMQPLQSASVTVNIKSTEPIKNVYSPTHKIDLIEREGWDISAEWSQENYLPKNPFMFYYQVAEDKVGASLVAHREPDEEGAFMLMFSPTIGSGAGQVAESDILPKDVVFCVDTSGSMLAGGKMDQARAALKHCVESLRPGDRFNIVDFSTAARSFNAEGLVAFDDASRERAVRYVEKLNARGGTAIEEALELSLKLLDSGDPPSPPLSKGGNGGGGGKADRRLKMILFATDGLPTIGERDPEAILRSIAKRNTDDVRIFVFGEGFDVNTKLLDFLALDHRGEADYILPDENISEKIGRFFDRVGSPLMTDLEIKIDGLEVTDLHPRRIPDVYKGEQVVVYGRYTGHGKKTVQLTGNVGGSRRTFEYELEFPELSEDDKNAFVPRLWAGKKVDFLLNEIRKGGMENKELVDEVTFLAKRYGIVTPYTSFLMAEDIVSAPQAQLAQQLQGRFGNLGRRPSYALPAAGPASTATPARESADFSGKPAVDAAKRLNELRRGAGVSGGAAAFDEEAERILGLEEGADPNARSSLSALRYIGSRTFYKSGEVWYDSRFSPEKNKVTRTVKVGSDEYLKLLEGDVRLAKYLALGDVVVRIKDKWVRFES
ncbi:MAG: VIT and VWA domain-containing protein [Planctomycetes bacterium]|nr:VIT and VWA domain-containing protein [Planctomycetota bacterium]